MEDLKKVIARNLCAYRKAMGLTQLELAEKLNYSDKAISKWERGDSLPDIIILKQIADLYNITVNDLIREQEVAKIKIKNLQRSKNISHILITMLSVGLIWLVAVCSYVLLNLLNITETNVTIFQDWHCFILAIPLSFIVGLVFSKLWFKWYITFFDISCLVWSIATTLDVFLLAIGYTNSYLLYIICIPIQLLVIFWFILKYVKKPKQSKNDETLNVQNEKNIDDEENNNGEIDG